MKLQLKTIVAAIALVVAAGPASAALSLNNAATGSSLLFYAFDDVTKTSYVQDLGQTYMSFLPASLAANSTVTTGISNNTGWTDYLASVSGNTSNTYWGVISGLTNNAGNTGNGLISTIRAGDTAAATDAHFAQTAANAKGAVGTPLRNAFIGINGATATAGTSATTGYFSASAAGDNIANNFGHNGAGKLVFNTDNLIGVTSAIQYGNSNAGFATTAYKNTYTFNGSDLVLAAVPEPTTYAMMLAGLMLVGGIAARRRNSAK